MYTTTATEKMGLLFLVIMNGGMLLNIIANYKNIIELRGDFKKRHGEKCLGFSIPSLRTIFL